MRIPAGVSVTSATHWPLAVSPPRVCLSVSLSASTAAVITTHRRRRHPVIALAASADAAGGRRSTGHRQAPAGPRVASLSRTRSTGHLLHNQPPPSSTESDQRPIKLCEEQRALRRAAGGLERSTELRADNFGCCASFF